MDVPGVLFLVLIFFEHTPAIKTCPLEYSSVNDAEIKVKWEFNNFSYVVSEPLCLKDDGTYLIRRCINGTWSPLNPSECFTTFESTCTQGLIPVDQNCLRITDPEPFIKHCPRNSYKFDEFNKLNLEGSFWLPFKKIGDHFMKISKDDSYGIEFDLPDNITDCMATNIQSDFPVNCSEKHSHVCSYSNKPFKQKQNHKPILDIKFDFKEKVVVLVVYRPENIYNIGNKKFLHCFTNAFPDELKTEVDYEEIYDNKNGLSMIVYQITPYEHPGEYWCEAYDLLDNIVSSKKVIAYRVKEGNEYALRAYLLNACSDCTFVKPSDIYDFLKLVNFDSVFKRVKVKTRVMKIFKVTNETYVEVILHVTTLKPKNVIGDYYRLKNLIEKYLPDEIEMIYFRNCDFCLPETYGNIRWSVTPIGTSATGTKYCLNFEGVLPTRQCLGNFIEGAYWSDDFGKCLVTFEVPFTTETLYKISTSTITENVTATIKELTVDGESLSPLDIYFIATSLYNISSKLQEESALDNVMEVVDNILELAKYENLKKSQRLLNSTDIFLDALDKLLLDEQILTKLKTGAFIIRKDRIIVHITKPFISNINGVAAYTTNNIFDKNKIVNIKFNSSFENLDPVNLDVATYVPEDLLRTLTNENNLTDLFVITTIFYNDKLFNVFNRSKGKVFGKVISVTIPNYGPFLKQPIPLLFRNHENNENVTHCSYYDYGNDAPLKSGRWSSDGGALTNPSNETFCECAFGHLTHFALLIMNQKLFLNEEDGDPEIEEIYENMNETDSALNIITLIGCALSLTGLIGIFLTAVCFRRWRNKAGTKILLQLSVTISLEIILTHLAGSELLKIFACNVVGMCLHYVVLSKFSWMFVSAILQYVRFVKVFTVLPQRLILKTMLFGYLFPLLPVVIVSLVAPGNYSMGAQDFCYPTGLALYLGLLLPIIIIVIANLIVFLLVMKNILCSKIEVHGDTRKMQRLQIYLAILLFFMLGLPWLFGILAEWLNHSMVQLLFIYLFCLTATLQGCVIFIFYVILDHDTRNMWVSVWKK